MQDSASILRCLSPKSDPEFLRSYSRHISNFTLAARSRCWRSWLTTIASPLRVHLVLNEHRRNRNASNASIVRGCLLAWSIYSVMREHVGLRAISSREHTIDIGHRHTGKAVRMPSMRQSLHKKVKYSILHVAATGSLLTLFERSFDTT